MTNYAYVATGDENTFSEKKYGFNVVPPQISNGNVIIYKPVRLSIDSQMVKILINSFNRDDFYANAKANHYLSYLKKSGLRLKKDKTGKHVVNLKDPETVATLCSWFLEIEYVDNEENYLYITPALLTPLQFYNCEIIDKSCDEVKEWKNKA